MAVTAGTSRRPALRQGVLVTDEKTIQTNNVTWARNWLILWAFKMHGSTGSNAEHALQGALMWRGGRRLM